jgi:undecaprenyl-diphosphatase
MKGFFDMLTMIEVLKAILFGVVEGITEWLPISSTGHMILLDEFVKLNVSKEFLDLFLVVIQLGAILAVVVIYWNKLIPLSTKHGLHISRRKCKMWVKIIVASIPAGVVGILWDDVFTKYFYNYQTVAIMLILVGVVFIIIERSNKNKIAKIDSIDDISYGQAFLIGVFQMIAAIFPGTSRSGSTIVGSLMLGISRTAAAEFTFFLAVPAMFGGSAIKILKYSGGFNSAEVALLAIGMIVAFVLSIIAIKFLMSYIKKHDFKVFGWYRIILGIAVIGYFLATR